jgi:large subunit ribosomal protein L9
MKVILKRDVRGIGRKDEVRDVADGYARNYLIARGLAVAAQGRDLAQWETGRREEAASAAGAEKRCREIARALGDLTLEIAAPADEHGTIYGSVTKEEILRALRDRGILGRERVLVTLTHPLKTIGDHQVAALLPDGSEITFAVTLRPRP